MRAVLSDAGPLSFVAHKNSRDTNAQDCQNWFEKKLKDGEKFFVPSIIDYEVRRELVRTKKTKSICHLDSIRSTLDYDPVTQEVLDLTADFWAQARNKGKSTASGPAMDGDMILCAHAELLEQQFSPLIVVTSNTKYVSLFCTADHWDSI